MNPTTSEDAVRRELVSIVNKLAKDARAAGNELAEDLGAILNHVMFGGRAAPAPHRRPGVRR